MRLWIVMTAMPTASRSAAGTHFVALLYAQLGGAQSLRGLEAAWNANAHHHYHLGVGRLARSTLADASARRPLAIFTETFAMLSNLVDRTARREGAEMVRLIDSSPIPLGKLVDWAKWNGRIKGLKLHVVHDPAADNPTHIAITDANVNDIEVGRQLPIEAGCTYVFDKAYCLYRWVDRPPRGRGPLRDPHEDHRPLQGVSVAAAQEAQGLWLHHPRRRRGQAGQQG